jgi:hypothetical protein
MLTPMPSSHVLLPPPPLPNAVADFFNRFPTPPPNAAASPPFSNATAVPPPSSNAVSSSLLCADFAL